MSTTKPAGTPIEGATALVTGGNRGFGRAIVDELLDRGAAKVYATSRSPHTPPDKHVIPLVLDVTNDDSVAAAAQAASDVSIVVNNAGISLNTPLLDAPLADIRSELETNLFGLIRVAREFAPSSLATPPARSSTCCRSSHGSRSEPATRSPKPPHGRRRTQCACELREQGTIVTALHVGYMDTDMTAHIQAPKADPRAIARQTADAILTGQYEILADETTRTVKSHLSQDLTDLYAQLAAA